METVLKKEIIVSKAATKIFGVGIFIILTSLGAFVRIPLPFTPVPVTLQTFFVLLSGACLGRKLGVASQLGYISLGVLGIPVFAGAGIGMLYLCGPTAGYLCGFIAAAFFLGNTLRFRQGKIGTLALFLLADSMILVCGSVWLKFLFGYSFKQALLAGFVPFVPGDCIKALCAVGIYLGIRHRLQEIFPAYQGSKGR